ncbi:MAG: glycerate kinase, partial [Armatimonadota bacterium]
MKIVLAPDSFKGSLTAKEVCEAMAEGIRRYADDCDIVQVPMADGGEGTVQSLVDATGGEFVQKTVTGPLGEPTQARYGIMGDGDTAVIEMAAASGLPLVPEDSRNPWHTTTYGTGELIASALDHDCSTIIVGIGGSATTDAGTGMAQALGAVLLDETGAELPQGAAGQHLKQLQQIDMSGLDPRVSEATFRVACDVDNPLYGENGAAYVYGPQKGADAETVRKLDAGLRNFARVVKEDLDIEVADVPGAGAAGGLGAGLIAFCGAKLELGVDIVLDAVDLASRVQGADLLITGEGAIDFQTAFGKAPSGAVRVATAHGVPNMVIAGAVDLEANLLHERGFGPLFSICNEAMALQTAMDPSLAKEMTALAAEEESGAVMIAAVG